MNNDKNDIELLNRIAKGGNITANDTGSNVTNKRGAITTLTEGTTALYYELSSGDSEKNKKK